MSEQEEFENWWNRVGNRYAGDKVGFRLAWLEGRISVRASAIEKLNRKIESLKI